MIFGIEAWPNLFWEYINQKLFAMWSAGLVMRNHLSAWSVTTKQIRTSIITGEVSNTNCSDIGIEVVQLLGAPQLYSSDESKGYPIP